MKGQRKLVVSVRSKAASALDDPFLYSNKESFCVSDFNASDAADKLRFRALSQPDLYEGDEVSCAWVSFDKDNPHPDHRR